ncbi:Brix-domain-containing protein [Clavulina sp. PMI_390]|nr:Brix-domain-containing protein [Clavulina sp. PMI_390]
MAKRRKNRTHLKGAGGVQAAAAKAGLGTDGAPKTFIVKHGTVGSALSQLVRDMRKLMEPNTATRLRERKKNKLKDFLVMAPALGVTHILAFTLTDIAPSLRVIRLSAGPTLSFRIERYSLAKDLMSNVKRAKSVGMEYLSPPLLVLASFPSPSDPSTPSHLPLVMKSFQSLFPPLAPTKISLSSARRVVLVSYNAERGTIDVRHYLISVRAAGISRRVRKILDGGAAAGSGVASSRASSVAGGGSSVRGSGGLNLGSVRDVADYLLGANRGGGEDDGYETAGSTSAASEGEEASVRLASDYTGRNNRKGEKRAVRLDEIGPRLELRLVKIAEGVPGKEGAVLYHEFVKKDPAEVAALKKAAAERAKLKKERREEQERNVQRKKAAKAASGSGSVVGDSEMADGDLDEDEDEDLVDEEEGDEDDWGDEDEEVSEGSEDDDDEADGDDNSSDDDDMPPPPPPKRSRK